MSRVLFSGQLEQFLYSVISTVAKTSLATTCTIHGKGEQIIPVDDYNL
ncbi:MAG: hypothetical protein KME18_22955 [Phormidium tanganyikae FI6-MK23]|jgi:hypothetical protein|nr:hypothetical protein [Phormidium tanganyikae FI6-MK23]